MAQEMEALLEYVLNVGGSELIITEGAAPAIRFAGKVCVIPEAPQIETGALREFLGSLEGETGSFIGGPWVNTKWRVRYFREALGSGAVLRPLLNELPAFSDLGAPEQLQNLLQIQSGLVVFAGPACSGKTTTASSFVSSICASKILRVSLLDESKELPIETGNSLVFENSSGSLEEKLEQAKCSGCDLFWLGDFKSELLIPMLRAAERGAIVVCTVTAGNSVGVVETLLSSVPAEERALARTMLASLFKAIVVQRLIPSTAENNPAIPAWEILFNNQNIAVKIRGGEYFKIPSLIASSAAEGMLLMDDCLAEFLRSGYITKEEAYRYVSNPARLG